jgi:hypothetical protein
VLTREIMGALALAILWVNTLLVAAVALKQAGAHLRRRRALAPIEPGKPGEGIFRATVEEGSGDAGAIARWELSQIGRAGAEEGGRRTIHFGDRTFDAAVLGGVVSAGGERVHVPAGAGEVWPGRGEVIAAAACSGQERFAAVFEEARKARGHARRVRVDLAEGRTVWIAGEVRRDGGELSLRAGDRAGLLVSAIDPRAWLRWAATLGVLFAIAEVIAAAIVTALVLVPPIFDGWTSKIGGALGLAFFLGVQPLGTMVRDAVREPGRAFVRGRWVEPAPVQGEGMSAQQRVPVE